MLILDEPTNDLDIDTLELLEDLLVEYKGTVIVISHDRQFINNIVTSVIVYEDDKQSFEEYIGDYSDWERINKTKVNKAKPVIKENKPKDNKKLPPSKSTQSLSQEQRKELNKLPKVIEKLEQQISDINSTMAEPGFYEQDNNSINKIVSQLREAESKLEQAYSRWDELEQYNN